MTRRQYPAMTSPRQFLSPVLMLAFLGCAIAGRAWAAAPSAAEGIAFFEKKIRPVLAEHCYKCHSATAEKIKGGLVLDTREGSRKGGDTGPAVVPGDLKASLLIKAVQWVDKDTQMPPKKKLSDEQIADFVKWVQMGAPDPREGKAQPLAKHATDIKEGRKHWAYQPISRPAAPAVKDAAWPRGDIDKFVLAELEERNLKPVGDADKATLLRRLYFDLIGLPPSPQEIEAFLADTSAGAVEKVVDRLLASPQYGERWGRHWLDVARFAESSGKERDMAYPHAWRYRDWVIRAFNSDVPYDRFILEQIAGDLLPARDDTQKANQIIATGYLAVGPKSMNTRDIRQFRLDIADEQIDSISQGLLGMTVACARCHDHKFDPIPTGDYYALAGIFMSTETRFGGVPTIGVAQGSKLIELPAKAQIPNGPPITPAERKRLETAHETAKKQLEQIYADFRSKKGRMDAVGFANIQGTRGRTLQLERQLESYGPDGQMQLIAMGAVEGPRQFDSPIYTRGEVEKPGEVVPRGVVQVINYGAKPVIPKTSSGRLELARWIASPANPLTARVMANRIWEHLFGRGIVASVDNFGVMGQPPSHPELLDFLARSLINNGWSIKKTIKQIVLSRSYQLASAHNDSNYTADPDNTYLWRMSKKRLEAEAIRDAMLAASGQLDPAPVLGSIVSRAGEGYAGIVFSGGYARAGGRFASAAIGPFPNPVESKHRSIYLPIIRDTVLEPLAVFDFAEPSLVTGQRQQTTVPSQALYLLNNPTVLKYSEAMGRRLMDQTSLKGGEKIRLAFQLIFNREPGETEMRAAADFFERFIPAQKSAQSEAGITAWTAFCQSLFAAAEFRYLN